MDLTEAAGKRQREVMAESGARLKKIRGAIRSSTTKLLNKIDGELSNGNPDLDVLEEYLEQLANKERCLIDYDRDIEAETKEEDLDEEINSALEYMDGISARKTRIRRAMRIEGGDSSSTSFGSQTNNGQRVNTVKLPKLVIQKFSGEISEWQGFWSQYETAIHNNQSLSKTEKFSYLKSFLTGTAASAVAGLALSGDNYDSAINMLTSRFGRKDLVINAHMNKLLNMTPVRKATDVVSLRKLYDDCEVQVRSLDAMGVVSDSYGSLLCPILLKMIPEEIALEFTRLKADNVLKAKDLMDFLKLEVESRERTANLTQRREIEKQEEKNAGRERERRMRRPYTGPTASAAAFHTWSPNDNSECLFCGRTDHKSSECTEFTVDIRREKLKRFGRCFICLGPRHVARNCRAQGIECEVCGKRHYKTVCNHQSKRAKYDKINGSPPTDTVVSVFPGNSEGNTVLLQTATIWIDAPKQSQLAKCLLDGGSQRSFIREDISRALNLPVVGTEIIKLHTFGSVTHKRVTARKVKASLRNLKTNEAVDVELLETPTVCSSKLQMADEKIRRSLEAKGLQVADTPVRGMEVEGLGILIGGDHYWNVVSGRTERLENGLVAVESKFGWLIQGVVSIPVLNVTTEPADVDVFHLSVGEEQILTEQLRSFWETESLGIHMDTEKSPETDAAWKFEESVKYKQGRYEVCLPWREDNSKLATNYCTALNRLNSLARRFQNNNQLYDRYNQVFQEYLAEGMIEEVTKFETENTVYYLPHHPVIRESRTTTKLRVVFDASSHERESRSLNDCLLTGPNLNPDLLSILIKFRQHRVAMMADINKAFLQISLNERDRDVLRFLWLKEKPLPFEELKVVIMRMTRVPFGASASPFLLAATIRHHLKKYKNKYPEEVKVLDECLYVDDFITGTENVDDAIKLSLRAKEILSSASMKLCKWSTNSPVLQNMWKQEYEMEQVEIKGQNPLKVLGLTWKTDTDEFLFETNELIEYLQDKRDTKRGVLQAAARIFDPIGFLSPFTIRVKCLFQEMWERGIAWDQDLPEDLAEKWHQWCSEISCLKTIAINRCYDVKNDSDDLNPHDANSTEKREIHVFTDASERAYCAAAYLRCVKSNGHCTTSLVASKTKVAPLKKMTLPRLELMGALIGARLGKFIITNLKMSENEMYFWTDSMITFHWIRSSSKQWKQFVANRVSEIQNLTLPEKWNHCAGKENPADRGTRGISAQSLKEDVLWWHGPEWLKDVNDETEVMTEFEDDVDEYVVQNTVTEPDCIAQPLFDLSKNSELNKPLRITAWIQRFVHNAQKTEKRTGELCTEEIQQAEKYWIKLTQSMSFSKEMDNLLKNTGVDKQSKIITLRPFLDDVGLLRVGGRLQEANWSYSQKHPYILPGNDTFSELLIRRAHKDVMHSGLQATLNQLRETYWILKGRQMTKRCVRCCLICKRARVKAGQQVSAPLPKERINMTQAFETTGVDFAGPLYIKPHNTKAYIALFTCAVTRAVHLELVSDLSTDAFLLAFRRFISRRGICGVIYSDNAKTFKRAEQDLKLLWTLMEAKEIQNLFAEKRISWKYIVERAAWWGGMWERLVRSVKTCLRKVLGRSYLGFEELQTLICEVEAVINSRPLTYLHTDSSEPSPLTPAHFITGQRITTLPSYPLRDSSLVKMDATQFNKRWQYRQRLINNFWTRWQKDYLMELRSAHCVSILTKSAPFKVGDVVLLYEDKQPKHTWKMGRIEETFVGRDGKIRSCAVRLPSRLILKRPVQLLYPLEVDEH